MKPIGEVTRIHVDPGNEQVHAQAKALLKGLIESAGLPVTIGVLLVALESVLIGILHHQSPMPEANAAVVEDIVTSLRDGVLAHKNCATHNGTEAPDDDEEPSCLKARVH